MQEKCFVLIDLENKLPDPNEIANIVKRHCFHFVYIKIFVGPKQNKMPTELAAELQKLGERAEYIFGHVVSKNANDFLIVFHIGRLSNKYPQAKFFIVSKDTGFDSLIGNVVDTKIQRIESVSEVLLLLQKNNCKRRRRRKKKVFIKKESHL